MNCAGAASRGEDSRGTSELTKAAAATASSNSSDHVCCSQPATPSTPAPTGALISASSYSTSNSAIAVAPAPGAGAGAAPPAAPGGHTFSYRHHHDHGESNEWDVKKWNEERERDRETWIHDPEWLRVESWIDEHPDFCLDYFLRYVREKMIPFRSSVC